MQQKNCPPAFICIIGNDGTGKSTMCSTVNENTKYSCVERSMKNSENQVVKKLVQQIRTLDKLTYSYAFQDDWYNFDISHQVQIEEVKIKVFWIMLTAPVQTLLKRINSRPDMTIYQHEKCIRYFNYVYQQMAFFYGMNLVNSDQPLQKQLEQIIKIAQSQHHFLPIRNLGLSQLNKYQLENGIVENLSDKLASQIYDKKILPEIQVSGMKNFYFPSLYDIIENDNAKKKLASRWIKNHATREFNQGQMILKVNCGVSEDVENIIKIKNSSGYFFQKIIQGQSKIIFKVVTNDRILHNLFDNKVIILLKSTIYSHTNQRTSQISQLGKVRAKGSMIFLEMLKRNQINHSYISLNRDGIILSRFVETNDLQIVFKKQCLGTDKHSFIGIRNNGLICNKDGSYKGGIYIRFDWRNPNHFLKQSPLITLNLDPYYYLVEKIAGKQLFFSKFLTNDKCKPVGDKCITEDLISQQTEPNKIKQMAIQAYCTFQYYAHEVGLQILDGCMMIDKSCKFIWSQINPDCLRVKTIKEREDYDKDIWRSGGSSSKQTILKKWSIFNQIFVQYFTRNRFMDAQVKNQLLCKQIYAKQVLASGDIRPEYSTFYRKLDRGNRQRQLIGTIDIINGEPILVQSSQFKQKHSNADIQQALQFISVVPQVLIVDIDGASGKAVNNKNLIQKIGQNSNINFYGVGGGIRTAQIANQYLTQFQHIVISSNLDIIQQIPKDKRDRIIVELSVNQQNQVLIHARTVNTGVKVIKKMIELCQLGIRTVSITFNNSEGKLQGIPRQQLRNIMYQIPGPIKKVIIAGGITSISDLQFIWGFPKCVPQLGSALWKKRISIGQIYSKILKFDQKGLVPAIVQNRYGKNLGLIYLNQQSIIKTCQQRVLYRFSRQHNRLMKKGEQSKNVQKIISMNTDCDNDTVLLTVDDEHPVFCHLETQSCFFQQVNKSSRKDLSQLQNHILKFKKEGGSGYSHQMQNNWKLAISKVMEQVEELSFAESKQRIVQQYADVFAHLLMSMNSQDIKIDQIVSQLNTRSKKQKKIKKQIEDDKVVRIGLAAGKHTNFIFEFLQEEIGVKILPHNKGMQRNYTINYEIINKQKFENKLKIDLASQKLVFVSMKPKDLAKLMQRKYIKFGINYSNVVENSLQKVNCLGERKVEGLRLALIKRKGENIEVEKWSQQNKGVIISEYPSNIVRYFFKKNIPSNCYKIIKVSGHSEGFLEDKQFNYCDAIVYSGKTIQDNNLEIQAIIEPEIKVILFSL